MERTENRIRPVIVVMMVLLAANLCATGGVMIYLVGSRSSEASEPAFSAAEQTTGYTLYIGTNDKDTYTQLIPTDEAKEIVNEICAEYVGGYTVTEANGGWVDETGTLTEEDTLIYYFTDVDVDDLRSIMDEALEKLNQNAILVEISDMDSFYYYGD